MCIAAYPHDASGTRYGYPPALAKADYSAIDRFLDGPLFSQCGTEAIYVHWIGGELFKHTAVLMETTRALDSIYLNLKSNQMKCYRDSHIPQGEKQEWPC